MVSKNSVGAKILQPTRPTPNAIRQTITYKTGPNVSVVASSSINTKATNTSNYLTHVPSLQLTQRNNLSSRDYSPLPQHHPNVHTLN